MTEYAKPGWKVVIGVILSALTSAGATFFGWFMMEVMTQMNISIFIQDGTKAALRASGAT